jgi:hypothetical protein
MFPSKIIDHPNPLYEYERRRIRYLADPQRYTVFVLLVGLGITILTYMVFLRTTGVRYGRGFNFSILFWVRGGRYSWVVDAIFGFYYMFVALRRIHQDIETGRWDTLRLTLIDEKDVVKAKYAIAQTRAWRVMVWHIVLRMMLVMVTTNALYGGILLRDGAYFTLTIVSLTTNLLLAVLTPFWMMQALTALGLYAGLLVQGNMALIVLFFTTIAVSLIQGVLTASSNPFFYRPYLAGLGTSSAPQIGNVFTDQVLISVVTVILTFGAFKMMQRVSIFRAERAVASPTQTAL